MSSFDLESPVADWAFGKDLVFAAAAVSSPAVISNQGGVKQQKLLSRLSLDGSLPSPSSLTKENPGVRPLLIVSYVDTTSGDRQGYADFTDGDVRLDYFSKARLPVIKNQK